MPITYKDAGVDIEAGDRAAELMKSAVMASQVGHTTFSGGGGFAGMYDISSIVNGARGMSKPILATSTDGVGTKVAIAQAMDIHNTIGFDLVGMVVDDIAVTGAKPLFMTDYICTGKVKPEVVSEIVGGIAAACVEANTALVGGETAEHPGLLGEGEYDVAGAATGIVDAEDVLDPKNCKAGDRLIALASSGIHSNGFSLVRAVCAAAFPSAVDSSKPDYQKVLPEFGGKTLGEVLLTPTKVYSSICLQLNARFEGDLKIWSHITGGGLASNLSRVLPQGLVGVIDRASWEVPQVFNFIQSLGDVPQLDMERTLNLGIGMIAVVAPDASAQFIEAAKALGVDAWGCGEVISAEKLPENIAISDLTSGTKGLKSSGSAVLV